VSGVDGAVQSLAAGRVLMLPLRVHADAVEELLERCPPVAVPPRFDARHVRAADPGAVLTLAILSRWLGVAPPSLPVPERALLPPRMVQSLDDVSGDGEVAAFLRGLGALGWSPGDARRLAALVGELCGNALRHAGAPAWVAAWRTAPGELRVAVADAGCGIAASLGQADAREAVLRAVVHGNARTADAPALTGLRRVARVVGAWGGRMHVRSGTVLLSGAPPWSDAELREQLPVLPGVQVELVLPCPPEGRLRIR
jgi:hypothetical protein